MIFNSYHFLFIFLPLVLSFYYISPYKWRNSILTLAGYIFYAYWNAPLSSLLFISTTWNYLLGKKIYGSTSSHYRKKYLVLAVLLNLGLLGYFKYMGFFIDSLLILYPELPVNPVKLILPIGISFFTFQGLSYVLDIYHRQVKPVTKFVDFACYITMFPQLIAGPIVRYSEISGQLITRQCNINQFTSGMRRFIVGLAKKVIVADSMAKIVEQQLGTNNPGFSSVWIGMTAFSLQVYFDFAGYSDMAIGLGSMFGFHFPENFHFPYQSQSMKEFWRRWHMTLSGWLRDYLYIPIGGSRCSRMRWFVNIQVTFLLCGLWHGASWTFVLWGMYHGLLIICERFLLIWMEMAAPLVRVILINILIITGWVLFKAENLAQAIQWYGTMLGQGTGEVDTVNTPVLLLLFMLLLILGSCYRNFQDFFPMVNGIARDCALFIVFMISVIIILGEKISPFLYYQF